MKWFLVVRASPDIAAAIPVLVKVPFISNVHQPLHCESYPSTVMRRPGGHHHVAVMYTHGACRDVYTWQLLPWSM